MPGTVTFTARPRDLLRPRVLLDDLDYLGLLAGDGVAGTGRRHGAAPSASCGIYEPRPKGQNGQFH